MKKKLFFFYLFICESGIVSKIQLFITKNVAMKKKNFEKKFFFFFFEKEDVYERNQVGEDG